MNNYIKSVCLRRGRVYFTERVLPFSKSVFRFGSYFIKNLASFDRLDLVLKGGNEKKGVGGFRLAEPVRQLET